MASSAQSWVVASLLGILAAGGLCQSVAPGSARPLLTHAGDIRKLSIADAKRGHPVRIRGVVTYGSHHPQPGGYPSFMFLQDSTAGIFVNLPPGVAPAQPNQFLELEGTTEAPDFSPQIGKPRWRVIGRAPLPAAPRVSFRSMATTAEDSRFVEVAGVVRTMEARDGELHLNLWAETGRIHAVVNLHDRETGPDLTDAEVRIRGVCGAIFNQRNQLTGVELNSADLRQIEVVRPGAPDVFDTAPQSLTSLQRFNPNAGDVHRIHVRGTVAYQEPGNFLYIAQGEDGLRVESSEKNALRTGDLVDVVGFPNLADSTPVLEDALVRRRAPGSLAWPAVIAAKQLSERDYDSSLVAVEGRLVEKSLIPFDSMLLLESNGFTIHASVRGDSADSSLSSLRLGSRLRITGIYVAYPGRYTGPRLLHLLVNSTAAITVLTPAPWWTLKRAFEVIGLTLTIIGLGCVWVFLLRRRVSGQTATISERLKQVTVLEENYRRLFDHHPHPMWVYDLETHRFLGVNDAAVRQYGYSPDEFLEMTIHQIRPAGEVSRLVRELNEHPQGLSAWDVWTHRTKDGTLIKAEIAGHEIIFSGRQARLIVAVNVTERERAKRLGQDRREIVEAIARNEPIENVMAQVIKLVEHELPAAAMWIVMLRDGHLHHLASSLPAGVLDAVNGNAALADGFAELNSRAWKTPLQPSEPEPVWATFRAAAIREGYPTCWLTPISNGSQRVLGCLAACSPLVRDPLPAEQEYLDMAAHLASIAIEQDLLHERLLFQAHHDRLTGLPNRFLLEDRLSQCLARSHRHGHTFAVLQMDLDRFSLINDGLGHAMGDALLQMVARRLASSVRDCDTLARMGGDEFTLLISDLKNSEDADSLADSLLNLIREPFTILDREIFITASIGIAVYPDNGSDSSVLLMKADAAMYHAKNEGKNRRHRFTKETPEHGNRLELENLLHRAQDRGELEVFYQPIYNVRDGSLAKREALLRWRHPRLGLIAPGRFIPIAEETGLIVRMGRWVMEQACRDAREWIGGRNDWTISVNVSAVQFSRDDFVASVSAVLAETGLEASRLELELTESLIMRDMERAVRQLRQLGALGVRIAIDDFGTGYSSLSYLQHLPVSVIKIDQCFIREMSDAQSSSNLVGNIVRMAHSLGLKVTAEGIETEAQMKELRRLRCDQAQGFLLGRPAPRAEAIEEPVSLLQPHLEKVG